MIKEKHCRHCPKYTVTLKGGYCKQFKEPVKINQGACEWFYQNETDN